MQNFIKTIINGVQSWTKKEIKNSTADWSQNDSSAADYVKNRTHWEEEAVVVSEREIDGFFLMQEPLYAVENPFKMNPVVGDTYTVVWDGVSYDVKMHEMLDLDGLVGCIGNTNYAYMESGGNIPFAIIFAGDVFLVTESTAASHTISISGTVVHKLDSKYLDLPTNLATIDEVQEAVEIAQSIADGKMDANNPVGTGSFSMNRMVDTTVGDNSHAEGYYTTASGNNSHAEGYYTTASGDYSHAEGYYTTASGDYSHAEGYYTTAEGKGQHVFGTFNRADTQYKIEYGMKFTNIFYPSAGTIKCFNEYIFDYNTGNFTPINYVEKKPDSTLLNDYKFVMYIDNIYKLDSYNTFTSSGGYSYYVYRLTITPCRYLSIAGNGVSFGTYSSNAHTLDWNGVGWFQGGLQVGGNAQDDGARNVLLEGDAVKLDNIAITISNVVRNWNSTAYGDGKFVAVAYNSNVAAYSEDGINWTETTLPVSGSWNSVTYGNGKFVAITSNSDVVAYSIDGINWVQTSTVKLYSGSYWYSVTYGDGKFVVVGSNYNRAAYSTDGINWMETTLPTTNNKFFSVTYGDNKFVAVGHHNSSLAYAAYSTDGINWTETTPPAVSYWKSVTYGDGKFVAVCGCNQQRADQVSNVAAYSEDGINWITTSLPISSGWNSVTYGNGKFVAVGYGSNVKESSETVAYSEDGITWTQTSLPVATCWDSVMYGNGRFISTSNSSSDIAYSEDGINWYNTYEILTQDNEDVTDKVRDLILPINSTAQVGQTIAVKSVDENGKPTEWEAVDTYTPATDESIMDMLTEIGAITPVAMLDGSILTSPTGEIYSL